MGIAQDGIQRLDALAGRIEELRGFL